MNNTKIFDLFLKTIKNTILPNYPWITDVQIDEIKKTPTNAYGLTHLISIRYFYTSHKNENGVKFGFVQLMKIEKKVSNETSNLLRLFGREYIINQIKWEFVNPNK